MAYKPVTNGPVIDKAYPSEIAAARPMLATRIQCADDPTDGEETLHQGDDPCARMNEALNAGRWKR